MYFDWVTWSIWAVGFIILVIWVWVPAKEFKRLQRKIKESRQEKSKLTANIPQSRVKE